MRCRMRVVMILGAACCLPTGLMAQTGGVPMGAPGINAVTGAPTVNTLNPYGLYQKHWMVAGRVVTLNGDPIPNVRVAVQPTEAGEFRTLITDDQGNFATEYFTNPELVKTFGVILIVNKKGYLKAHELVDFGEDQKTTMAIPITLREPIADPQLLSQAEMSAAFTARLKSLGPADGLSSKSEKDYAHGVEAYLDHQHPDHALPSFSKVIERDPLCVACRAMLAMAELDSGDWDGANRNFSRGVDDIRSGGQGDTGKAKALPGMKRPEPIIALGIMESWRHQEERAAQFFQEALTLAPNDALALQEMGRMQMFMRNFSSAASYLGKAVAAGGSPEARLLHSEALLDVGDFDAANQEMTKYLDGRDVKTMPLYVRQVWARIGERKKIEVAYLQPKTKAKSVPAIDYLHSPIPELKDLVVAKDQAPLQEVLTEVGKNVESFFKNFPNTVSLEEIHQEKVSHRGRVDGSLDQKFHYLCLMPEDNSELAFNEYRANMTGDAGQPQGLKDGFMLTSGFASVSLIFHPLYQSDSNFKYLGQQKVDGRDTYVIAYAQRPEKSKINGIFKMGPTSMPTFSQGLAWIDGENYQIIRMRTDLLRPLPEVRLDKETTEIDFGQTRFKSVSGDFWLPREVKVSVDWNGHALRNLHDYSDFKLFSVGATEKLGKPKEAGQSAKQDQPGPDKN